MRGDSPGFPELEAATLRSIEKRAIWEALERNHWRRMATARELGVDKNTLRRKMIRHGLEPSPHGSPGDVADVKTEE
jgi:transcriptional regulator of acetoin/glycerol metabolism